MLLQRVRILLTAVAASAGIACTTNIPVSLVLEEPSDIAIEIVVLGNPTGIVAGTTLVGGADITVSLSFTSLFNPGGILAVVTIDDIRISGPSFSLIGQQTGTICASEVPDSGGGTALIKPLHGTAQFDVIFDTVVHALGPLGGALPEGFAFQAPLQATVPLSFGDLLSLFLGRPGGLQLSQTVEATIEGPGDGSSILDLIDGSPVIATLTLVSADEIADDPLLDECADAGF